MDANGHEGTAGGIVILPRTAVASVRAALAIVAAELEEVADTCDLAPGLMAFLEGQAAVVAKACTDLGHVSTLGPRDEAMDRHPSRWPGDR